VKAEHRRSSPAKPTTADAHANHTGSFAALLDGFRGCFTAPTFTTFTALCAGLLAQPGPGTVTGMLTGARLAGSWHHARPHRFFTTPAGGPTGSACCFAT
jgi:hypothetical protein